MVVSLPREQEIGSGCWMVQGGSLRTDEGNVFITLHMDLIPWTTLLTVEMGNIKCILP